MFSSEITSKNKCNEKNYSCIYIIFILSNNIILRIKTLIPRNFQKCCAAFKNFCIELIFEENSEYTINNHIFTGGSKNKNSLFSAPPQHLLLSNFRGLQRP